MSVMGSYVDKTSWGPGPWQVEDDSEVWVDRETGLTCAILRNIHVSGSLNGYVGVPEQHPSYGLSYNTPWLDEDEVENPLTCICYALIDAITVHGGLTYANGSLPLPLEEGLSGPPIEGLWWFGFDTSRGFDLCPLLEMRRPRTTRFMGDVEKSRSDIYRDWAYVEAQVEHLARQLREIG